MSLPATTYLSPEEYLAWENLQPYKHEYCAGDIYAMVGAKRTHVTVAGNLFNLLSAHLDNSPCRVYMADMKLQVAAVNAYFYPDVFVTCDAHDHQAELAMSAPTLIVEVLSESTGGYDRGEKFAAYRKLPSLKEYLLIDPESRSVECFRLGSDGHWVLFEYPVDEKIRLESIGFEATVATLFKNVD